MDDSDDNISSDEIKYKINPLFDKAKPKKRSLIERELETSLTDRVILPITNDYASSTSRYGRARRLVNETDMQEAIMKSLKSPNQDKSPKPAVQSPVYKMHASNSPIRVSTPKKSTENLLDCQIENIYSENISLSRFGATETLISPSKRYPKVYIRRDLIQTKNKDNDTDETVTLIKNIFSPVKSAQKSSSNVKSVGKSTEKYIRRHSNTYLDTSSVVKTLDFDENKKKKRETEKKMPSKSEIFDMEAQCLYQVGDLVWARMGTYPFWPCIITREPFTGLFVKKKLFGKVEHYIMHVTFFGDNGRRSWIVDTMLRKFLGQLEFEVTRSQFTPEAKKKDPRLYMAFFVSEKKMPQWSISVEEAEMLLREPKRLRIDMLNNMLQNPKIAKTTPKSEKRKKVTRTDSDVSLSESLYDSLFSEDDSKANDLDKSRGKSRNKSLDVSEVVTACLDNMAAKTGITKIQRQSHMDRWLQKAKCKTPEKLRNQLACSTNVKKKKKEQMPLPSIKPYTFRKSINESQEVCNKLMAHQNEHDYSKCTEEKDHSNKNVDLSDGNKDLGEQVLHLDVPAQVESFSKQSDCNNPNALEGDVLSYNTNTNHNTSDSNICLKTDKDLNLVVQISKKRDLLDVENLSDCMSNEMLESVEINKETRNTNQDLNNCSNQKSFTSQCNEENSPIIDVLMEENKNNDKMTDEKTAESLVQNNKVGSEIEQDSITCSSRETSVNQHNEINLQSVDLLDLKTKTNNVVNKITSDCIELSNDLSDMDKDLCTLSNQEPTISHYTGKKIQNIFDNGSDISTHGQNENVSETINEKNDKSEANQDHISSPNCSLSTINKTVTKLIDKNLSDINESIKYASSSECKQTLNMELVKDREKNTIGNNLITNHIEDKNFNNMTDEISDETKVSQLNKNIFFANSRPGTPISGHIEIDTEITDSEKKKNSGQVEENAEKLTNRSFSTDTNGDSTKSLIVSLIDLQSKSRGSLTIGENNTSKVGEIKDDEQNLYSENLITNESKLTNQNLSDINESCISNCEFVKGESCNGPTINDITKSSTDVFLNSSQGISVCLHDENKNQPRKLSMSVDEMGTYEGQSCVNITTGGYISQIENKELLLSKVNKDNIAHEDLEKCKLSNVLMTTEEEKNKYQSTTAYNHTKSTNESINDEIPEPADVLMASSDETNKCQGMSVCDNAKNTHELIKENIPEVGISKKSEFVELEEDMIKVSEFNSIVENSESQINNLSDLNERSELTEENNIKKTYFSEILGEAKQLTPEGCTKVETNKVLNYVKTLTPSTPFKKMSSGTHVKGDSSVILRKNVSKIEEDSSMTCVDLNQEVNEGIIKDKNEEFPIELNEISNKCPVYKDMLNTQRENYNNSANCIVSRNLENCEETVLQNKCISNRNIDNLPDTTCQSPDFATQNIPICNKKSSNKLKKTSKINHSPVKLTNGSLEESRFCKDVYTINGDISDAEPLVMKFSKVDDNVNHYTVKNVKKESPIKLSLKRVSPNRREEDKNEKQRVRKNLSLKVKSQETVVNGYHNEDLIFDNSDSNTTNVKKIEKISNLNSTICHENNVESDQKGTECASITSEDSDMLLSIRMLRWKKKQLQKTKTDLNVIENGYHEDNYSTNSFNGSIEDSHNKNLSEIIKVENHELIEETEKKEIVTDCDSITSEECNLSLSIRRLHWKQKQLQNDKRSVVKIVPNDYFDKDYGTVTNTTQTVQSSDSRIESPVYDEQNELDTETNEKETDCVSIASEDSEMSLSRRKLHWKEKQLQKSKRKAMEDPEFLKYLEFRQDSVIDENPDLTQEEIINYLYKTWLYEENLKIDKKISDEMDDTPQVKGLHEELPVKKVRKKFKIIEKKDIQEEEAFVDFEDVGQKEKSKRAIVRPLYKEDFSDVEEELELFQVFKPTKKESQPIVAPSDKPETEIIVKPEVKVEEVCREVISKTDQVEMYFQQLTVDKPNIFKGLIREKVCEICEKTGNLFKCKTCHCMFHVECVKNQVDVPETPIQIKKQGRKKKKRNRGRKPKNIAESNAVDYESHSDEKHDASVSDELHMSAEDHIVANADDFETQITLKMKEVLENTDKIEYNSDSSEILSWSDTEAGKCEVVDIQLRKKSDTVQESDFKCNNCQKYDTPVCSVCKSAVSPKTKVEERQRCQVAHCYQYYHLECLDHWPQTQFSTGEKSKNNKRTEYFEALSCPRHVCHTCVSDDPRGCKTRFSGDKLARCVRCPATYHSFTKCIPAGTQILTGSLIICPRHYKHRPGKVPCHVNTGWCFICALGGTLICCEYCPTSFHAECLNIKPPEGGYMCEDCETGRLPLYGEMVWVKLGHYRWWPGIILHPSEIPANILAVKHSQGEFVVRFFGQYDHYWVNRGRVFPFQEGDSGKISSQKSKIDAAFTMAVEHAQRACEILKTAKPNQEESQDIASSLLPPHYVKLKVNKPVGSLTSRKMDLEESSLTQCECDPNDIEPCGPYSQCLNRMLLTECGPTCRAGEKCNNRAFEKRLYPKMEPYRTPQRGWGLKSLEDIRAGQFVIEYVGELISEEEFQRRMQRKHEVRDENFYFLTLDKERMIDAGPKGNLARFMNHSCEPNCETQKWTVLGDIRVGLFAINDIPANSELTFNYNLESAGIEKKRCMCGAKRCSGYIGAKPKQEEPKKNKLAIKRTHKKRKNEESPTINGPKPKPKLGRPLKPKEMTEIEKDLLIIKNATNGMSSDSECSRLSIESKDSRGFKRKRVNRSSEDFNQTSPSIKRAKVEIISVD